MITYIIKVAPTGCKIDFTEENGEIIASSEVFKSRRGCYKRIESIGWNAPEANFEDQTVAGFKSEEYPKFVIFKDEAGEFRFRLKAGNGKIIVASEGFKTMDDCWKGIDSVKKSVYMCHIVIKDC